MFVCLFVCLFICLFVFCFVVIAVVVVVAPVVVVVVVAPVVADDADDCGGAASLFGVIGYCFLFGISVSWLSPSLVTVIIIIAVICKWTE